MNNGYSYLEITLLEQSGDPRGAPPFKNSGAETLGFGTHIADYDFALGELISAGPAPESAGAGGSPG